LDLPDLWGDQGGFYTFGLGRAGKVKMDGRPSQGNVKMDSLPRRPSQDNEKW